MADMTHDLSELNQYTGLFTGFCALALFFVVSMLGQALKTVQRFHEDYRKVNDLDRREDFESTHL